MTATSEKPLVLSAETAADLMCAEVASLPKHSSFPEAIAFFIDRNVTVAPVVGDRGETVGVLSVTDLLIHVRQSAASHQIVPATVESLMTPTIFSVAPETPAEHVIADMIRSKVHHLFVADPDGRIHGVVSTCDLLKHLSRDE
jgi:CBS-domain-containing membrane protein